MRLFVLFCLLCVPVFTGSCSGAAVPPPPAPPSPGTPARADAASPGVELGRYLVDHLYDCGGCHTPRLASGEHDPSRYLAGAECITDVDPEPGRGCIHSKNLTNHARGLANVTDDRAVKDMFLRGRRPDGKLLHPVMPAFVFHAMPAEHADAIVAYLRTVPGVDHLVPPHEAPFETPPSVAVPPVDLALLPVVSAESPAADSAERGRRLVAAACIGCHTPPAPAPAPGASPLDLTRLFAGGRRFRAAVLHLPSPPLPAVVYSQNLTQHASGLLGWSADDIVRVLKHGKDRTGREVCRPMPSGPAGAFAGLSDGDARDIANYVALLPGIDHAVPEQCALGEP
jgi:mono/diheme cytochrome c family protein